MKNTKKTVATPKRVVVTDPKEAVKMLREFQTAVGKTSLRVITTTRGGTKTTYKGYTLAEVIAWYQKHRSQSINPGWFGRALNAAAKTRKSLSINEVTIDGNSRSLYRIS